MARYKTDTVPGYLVSDLEACVLIDSEMRNLATCFYWTLEKKAIVWMLVQRGPFPARSGPIWRLRRDVVCSSACAATPGRLRATGNIHWTRRA